MVIRSILIAAVTFALLACKNEAKQPITQAPKSKATIQINLVTPPSFVNQANTILQAFSRSFPTLEDGSAINFNIITEQSLSAASRLASGDLKAQLWLSTSSYLINYGNSTLTAMGARQKECTRVFSSPLVIAVPSQHLHLWQNDSKEIDIIELVKNPARFFAAQLPVSLGHGNPRFSDSGLLAALALDRIAERSAELPLYSHTKDNLLLRRASLNQQGVDLLLTTEQQLVAYNLERQNTAFTALYPTGPLLMLDYSLCRSDAPWQGRAENRVTDKLLAFILSPEIQQYLRGQGYRPIIKLPPAAPLTPASGVTSTLSSIEKSGYDDHQAIQLLGKLHQEELTQQITNRLFWLIDNAGTDPEVFIPSLQEMLPDLLLKMNRNDWQYILAVNNEYFKLQNLAQETTIQDIRILLSKVPSMRTNLWGDPFRNLMGQISELPSAQPKTVIILTDGSNPGLNQFEQNAIDSMRNIILVNKLRVVVLALQSSPKPIPNLLPLADALGAEAYIVQYNQLLPLLTKLQREF